MDEDLKYYKLSGEGIEANIIVACKPDEVERLFKKYEGYTLEETEKPEGAHIVPAQPPTPMDPFALELRNYASMYEPFINVKHSVYDTKTCERCKNRHKRSEFCDRHCHDSRCYRFKFDR